MESQLTLQCPLLPGPGGKPEQDGKHGRNNLYFSSLCVSTYVSSPYKVFSSFSICKGTKESPLCSPQRTRSSTSLSPLQAQGHPTHFNEQLNEVSEPDNYLHKKQVVLGLVSYLDS